MPLLIDLNKAYEMLEAEFGNDNLVRITYGQENNCLGYFQVNVFAEKPVDKVYKYGFYFDSDEATTEVMVDKVIDEINVMLKNDHENK